MAASDTIFQAEVDLRTDLIGYVGEEREAIERLLGQMRQVRRMLDAAFLEGFSGASPVTTYQQLETIVVEDLIPLEAIDAVAATLNVPEPKSRHERLFGPDLI